MSKTTGKKKTQTKSKLWIAVIVGVLLLAVIIIAFAITGSQHSKGDTGGKGVEDAKRKVKTIGSKDSKGDTGEQFYADIIIKDYGTITILLDADAAPETVENFISLAESGFYDGLTFHRIIEGFMMQGGDPNGNGTGGSETTITGEFSANGYDNTLSHTRGTVSMARAKNYNSASSQFFIVHEDSTFLDGEYAAFGQVTSGMDIVDKICADAKPIDGNGLIAPDAQPVIVSVTIHT